MMLTTSHSSWDPVLTQPPRLWLCWLRVCLPCTKAPRPACNVPQLPPCFCPSQGHLTHKPHFYPAWNNFSPHLFLS